DEAWEAISVVVTTALLLLVGVTLLFVVIAPTVIHLYSFRLKGSAGRDQQAVATALLRMFAPQILFYGMTALVAAVLNARHKFVLPMATPILNNLIVIGVLLIVPHMAYSAAYIFFQLPYGILAVSILTALTPDLAERWSRHDLTGFRRRLGTGIRTGALVLLPAAVGYLVLARPLIALLLEHGHFTSAN